MMKIATFNYMLIVACLFSVHFAMAQSYTSYPPIPGSSNTTVMNAVGFDNSQRMWIETANIGAFSYDATSGTWLVLNSGNGLPSDSTLCIDFRSNEAWIGTTAGVLRYSG